MRWVAVILAAALIWACPAHGDDIRLGWPLRPRPAVVRTFDAPAPDWNRGHRGVDLAGMPGQPVYAAGAGTVVYAGMLAGRQVVSLAHPGGLHTSYEPVQASVRVGQLLASRGGDRRIVARASGLSGRGVFALGSDVGPGRPRRLCRSAGVAGVYADPAQAAARVTFGRRGGVDARFRA